MTEPSQRRDERVFLQQLFALDDLLDTKGFPKFSPWWRETLSDFYLSGCPQAVIGKGRRIGASTITAPRTAVTESLHGQHRIPPGERGTFALVSVKRGEAQKRLTNIKAILDAVGVVHDAKSESIALRDYPIDFAVKTANHRTEVGDLCIGVWCDEVPRWRDEESGSNPAREVLAALRPTMATMPNARIWLVGSPLSTTDAHAAAFAQGNTEHQRVYRVTTWDANPLLSEADTRRLEPDERTWRREYGAEPSAAVEDAFENIDGLVSWGVTERPYQQGVHYFITYDPGTKHSDTTVGSWHFENTQPAPGGPVRKSLVLDSLVVLKPTPLRPVKFDEIVDAIVGLANRYRCTTAYGDIHLHAAIAPAAQQRGIRVELAPMDPGTQSRRTAALLGHVRAGSLDLLDNPDLLKQLRQAVVRERAGKFIITKPDSRHAKDDALDCLLLACDEKFAKYQAGGGRIGSEWGRDGRRHWFTVSEVGVRTPCLPPVGSVDWMRLAYQCQQDGTHIKSVDDWLSEPANQEALARHTERHNAYRQAIHSIRYR